MKFEIRHTAKKARGGAKPEPTAWLSVAVHKSKKKGEIGDDFIVVPLPHNEEGIFDD